MERSCARGGPEGQADRPPLEAAAPEPPARWSAVGCGAVGLIAFVAGAALQIGGLRLLGVRLDPARLTPGDLLLATMLQDVAIVLIALVLARRFLSAGPADLGLAWPSRQAIGIGLVAGVAIFALTLPLEIVQRAVFGSPEQSIVTAFQRHRGLEAFALDVLAGVVIAPFGEELLFRGLLFKGLCQRMPLALAAALSAAAFVVPHGASVALPLFAAGVVLALVYERTHNLFANVTAHAVFNLIGLTISFLVVQ
jgi:membrane protease YdiL (CAAX protease family)